MPNLVRIKLTAQMIETMQNGQEFEERTALLGALKSLEIRQAVLNGDAIIFELPEVRGQRDDQNYTFCSIYDLEGAMKNLELIGKPLVFDLRQVQVGMTAAIGEGGTLPQWLYDRLALRYERENGGEDQQDHEGFDLVQGDEPGDGENIDGAELAEEQFVQVEQAGHYIILKDETGADRIVEASKFKSGQNGEENIYGVPAEDSNLAGTSYAVFGREALLEQGEMEVDQAEAGNGDELQQTSQNIEERGQEVYERFTQEIGAEGPDEERLYNILGEAVQLGAYQIVGNMIYNIAQRYQRGEGQAGVEAFLNQKNHQQTVLQLAVEKKDDVMIKLLIDYGADIHLKNRQGQTVLDLVDEGKQKTIKKFRAEKRLRDIANYGVDLSIDPESRSEDLEQTFVTAQNEGAKVGADINSVDQYGMSALHYAALRSRRQLVELLVTQGGVDLEAIDNEGQTALDLAKGEVKEYLQQVTALNMVGSGAAAAAAQSDSDEEDLSTLMSTRQQIQQSVRSNVGGRQVTQPNGAARAQGNGRIAGGSRDNRRQQLEGIEEADETLDSSLIYGERGDNGSGEEDLEQQQTGLVQQGAAAAAAAATETILAPIPMQQQQGGWFQPRRFRAATSATQDDGLSNMGGHQFTAAAAAQSDSEEEQENDSDADLPIRRPIRSQGQRGTGLNADGAGHQFGQQNRSQRGTAAAAAAAATRTQPLPSATRMLQEENYFSEADVMAEAQQKAQEAGTSPAVIDTSRGFSKNPRFRAVSANKEINDVLSTTDKSGAENKFHEVVNSAISSAISKSGVEVEGQTENIDPVNAGIIMLIAIKNGGIGNSLESMRKDLKTLQEQEVILEGFDLKDLEKQAINFSREFQAEIKRQNIFTGNQQASDLVGLRLKRLDPTFARNVIMGSLPEEQAQFIYNEVYNALGIETVVKATTDTPPKQAQQRQDGLGGKNVSQLRDVGLGEKDRWEVGSVNSVCNRGR